jgi:glycosyltransferase involved in cell wall biosynthesis/tetratricopeptide (TPR) repeat protein
LRGCAGRWGKPRARRNKRAAAEAALQAKTSRWQGRLDAARQVGNAAIAALQTSGGAPTKIRRAARMASGHHAVLRSEDDFLKGASVADPIIGLGVKWRLKHIVALLRAGLMRRKLGVIHRANLARDARQWELAAELYRKALERNPGNPPIWVQYGHALKESGELRDPHSLMQAESAYRKAVSLDQGVADSYLQLGHVLKLQGKVEEARAAYLQANALGYSLDSVAMELTQLGWSEAHFSELRGMLGVDIVPACTPSDAGATEENDAIPHPNVRNLSAQGLSASDPDDVAAPQGHDWLTNDKDIVSCEFDRGYYLRAYPDIDPAVVDPLDHFCVFGWREGRNPCGWFSTRYYLNVHKDIADAGINPFVHYLKWGRAEGRRIAGGIRSLTLDPKASLVSDTAILDFLTYPSRPVAVKETTFDPNIMDIHWVIPDYGVGQGGHMTIFRIVRWLEIFGHRCTIWINPPLVHTNSSTAFEDIIKHYQPVRCEVRFLPDGFSDTSGDAVIATNWQSVQIVSHAQNFKDRFYFVQDYEPEFHPRGSLSVLAESTYLKDLACICCGTWLEGIMRDRYGRWARHFWLAADTSTYFRPLKPHPPNRVPRIAFYGRIDTWRRAVELGLAALEHLASQGVEFHVDVFGADLDIYCAPFPCTLHGILASEALGELYRSADLGLCFSTTNYSIVPQEMMACGLPVLEIDLESTRAIYPDGVVTFCGRQPLEIAEAIDALLRDPDRRRRQADAAAAWVSSFSWEQSGRLVEAAICDRLSERGYSSRTRLSISAGAQREVRASVFIPTYNGGEVFKRVIDMLRRQRSPWRFEIIVIDSSSSDGTDNFCRDATDIVFEQIPQSEFNHGGTRNRGVELAQGAFVAFLTQDALPADEFWLYNLVSLLEAYPNAAGAFGHHVAWPDASSFTKRDLIDHFKKFAASPIAVSKETDAGRWASEDKGWRQFLHFYSDNNSCMRRSVWKQIPLPNVEFGEDQLWANQIMEAGYQKIYAHAATVYHSHDYDYDATLKRAEEEAAFFKAHFDYDLVNSTEELEAVLASCNESDSRWASQHGISAPELTRRLHLNRARLEGYLSGYKKTSMKSVAAS